MYAYSKERDRGIGRVEYVESFVRHTWPFPLSIRNSYTHSRERACVRAHAKAHCLNECTLFVLQKGLELYQSCLLFCGKSTSRHRLPYYYIIALYNCVMLSSPKLISSLVRHIDSFRSMVLCVCVLVSYAKISWLNSRRGNTHSAYLQTSYKTLFPSIME